MKNLHLLSILFVSIVILSCNKDDSNDDSPPGAETFQATIDGGTFSNYPFMIGVYDVTKGTNGNTLSINIGDSNGEMITLFLNGTGGFESGTEKIMGNVDSNDFMTYGLIRQSDPQLSYYSISGSVTITGNRDHSSISGHRLISGSFDITARTIDNNHTTTLSGSFNELNYAN